jgi:hypothetical protein
MKRSLWFSLIPMLVAVSGCSPSGPAVCSAVTTGMEAKYVVNALTVPMQKTDFAMDLNGDNKLDNQLGNIIGALTAQNLDVQMGVNDAITMGSVILLLDQTAANLSNDSCSKVSAAVGNKPANPPKYDGTDSFTVNSSIVGGSFKGAISNNFYNSNSPVVATAQTETQLTIQLPLVAGAEPINLIVHGGHIQFTSSAGMLKGGQINGAIKNDDVQNSIIPSVAVILTNKVTSGTGMASTNQQILDIFDTGGNDDPAHPSGCTNPDGTPACKNLAPSAADFNSCAVKGDKKISTCEVATNSIIKNVLAPDVQMFQGGVYMPNAANTMKDSLSLGLGFTAVKADFMP